MTGFFEKFEENARLFADKRVLCDDVNTKGITFSQLDTVSGKVYAYLQSKGVGKEDFVMICLPRGMTPIIALMGVWKNGSAFVIVEDNYAPERIEFIKKDCGCKVVINADVWQEIQTLEPKAGHEPVDERAAAFAVYTSGTTGNPKGVLHEYGNIDRMINSVTMSSCEPLTTENDRFALVAPLNFVASLLIIVYGLYYAVLNFVVPYAVIKNPLLIGMFIIKNKITGTFLTPSYIRKLKQKPPMLKFCIIGSEPANEVWLDGLTIHNFYLMSESGFAVAHFKIDKKYSQTPVGHSEFGHHVMLLDENGNEVPDGEEGEICFENKYVRGYINLPEETEKAFKNGIYHTADLAVRNENGDLIIKGRLNDMVKINGNRVEPGEIEEVAKKVLGIDWAAARIFDDGSRVFIAVYYLDKKLKVDFDKTRKAMEQYLPYYMLPSYFIQIDEIPLKATGKMDRKALPAPKLEDYIDDYAAPRDELETALCNAFAKVLKIERVGIHDDFYKLGGDSLASMEVLVESKINGLSAADVFAGHTPEKIAEIYKTKYPNGMEESNEERDERGRKEAHSLTPYQTYMIDYQMYTPMSTMLNLFTMLRFDKEQFAPEKMAQALEKVIEAHPALTTKFVFNNDGEIVQEYHPELCEKLTVEKMTEKEFQAIKDSLVKPFRIINSRLYRLRVFETEEAGYAFFDVHHTVFDGTSFQVIFADIIKAYYDMELDRDYYYMMLNDREAAMKTDRYLEDKKYFEELYDGEFSTRPQVDFEVRENTLAQLSVGLSKNEEAMQAVEEKYKVTRNAFFSLVSMMSVAIYNKKDDIKISWTYNGRDDLSKMNTIGLLLNDLPVAVHFKKDQMIKDLYADVQKQLSEGIAHNSYPYTTLGKSAVDDDMLCFLYQEDIRDAGGEMDDLNIDTIDVRQNTPAAENILDVQILDGKSGLELVLDYAASRYKRESMERFSNIFVAVTEVLLSLCDEENATVKKALKKILSKVNERSFFILWMK